MQLSCEEDKMIHIHSILVFLWKSHPHSIIYTHMKQPSCNVSNIEIHVEMIERERERERVFSDFIASARDFTLYMKLFERV